jgi:hypothetical protein
MIEDPTTIPDLPEWLYTLLWINVAVAVVWVTLMVVVHLRRQASNLTPVNAPHARKSAAPDFLKVDHKARKAQIARGEAYDDQLTQREEAEEEAGRAVKQVTLLSRLAGVATFLVSIFSLVATAVGVLTQVDRIGGTMSQVDQLGVVIQKYPIQFAVCAFVIGYYVVMFFVQKQWMPRARR